MNSAVLLHANSFLHLAARRVSSLRVCNKNVLLCVACSTGSRTPELGKAVLCFERPVYQFREECLQG